MSSLQRPGLPPTPSAASTPLISPILSIYHGETEPFDQFEAHSHPEPILMSSSTATLAVLSQARDWLVPPGYGLWVPGGVEHAASALWAGEISVIMFAPDRCPITWTEPTVSRLFVSQTGLSFARWRTQVRIRAAIQMLANGTAVDAVARAVGYRKTSAFIAAFRRTTGHTPGTYTHAGAPPAVR